MGSPASSVHPGGIGGDGGLVLVGPLLTEREFARLAGLSRKSVREDPCLPRIESPFGLGAAYPAFMLGPEGIRLDVAFVTLLLRRRVPDLLACDWLVRPSPALGRRTPLDWVGAGLPLEAVVEALPVPLDDRGGRQRTSEVEEIRDEWLRSHGREATPGWTIAWDRIVRRSAPTPHGV